MMNTPERERRSHRKILALILIATVLIVTFAFVFRPLLLPYFFTYAKIIISESWNYEQRLQEIKMELAHKEWRMYQIESRFGQKWCKEKHIKSRSNITWLTIVVDENFAPSALALGHSIRTFSCQKNMIALISETVNEGTRKALQSIIIIIVLTTPQGGVYKAACGFRNRKIFLGEWVISPQPNLITRRTGRLLLVWTLTIDLSGMGGPTRRTKSPASIALRFTETHKPVHHDKVAISTEQVLSNIFL